MSNEKVKWVSLSNGWWFQKTFFSENGLPSFTYHYKTKLCSSCIVFELETECTKKLNGYMLIDKDLRDAFDFLEGYIKISNEMDSFSSKKLLLKSLLRSMIITYGKCFVSATGRGVKLTPDIISKHNNKCHCDLIHSRHEYIAHGGKTSQKRYRYVCLLPPNKKYRKGQFVKFLTCDELYNISALPCSYDNIKSLFEELKIYTNCKITKLKEKIAEDINNIDPEKFYNFSKGKPTRSILTQIQLNKLKKN